MRQYTRLLIGLAVVAAVISCAAILQGSVEAALIAWILPVSVATALWWEGRRP